MRLAPGDAAVLQHCANIQRVDALRVVRHVQLDVLGGRAVNQLQLGFLLVLQILPEGVHQVLGSGLAGLPVELDLALALLQLDLPHVASLLGDLLRLDLHTAADGAGHGNGRGFDGGLSGGLSRRHSGGFNRLDSHRTGQRQGAGSLRGGRDAREVELEVQIRPVNRIVDGTLGGHLVVADPGACVSANRFK